MKPQLVEQLCRRLRRHGLALRYVARVRAELTDHFYCAFNDCLSSGITEPAAIKEAQSRLGDANELFEAIISRREHESFVHRHPFLTFALFPVPIAVVLAYAIAIAGRLTYVYVQRRFNIHYLDSTFVAVVDHAFYLAAYGVTSVVALYFCRLAMMYRCPISFAFISCLTLALAGGALKLDLVQCVFSGGVKYFQRYGWDAARLSLPLAVFIIHTSLRFLLQGRRVPILHA
ncbi:MAG: hypothetical protein H7Z14_21810 [Anaerolineae bacterium]|nr:hypothetical protein [Phycisphaerae bacterium]